MSKAIFRYEIDWNLNEEFECISSAEIRLRLNKLEAYLEALPSEVESQFFVREKNPLLEAEPKSKLKHDWREYVEYVHSNDEHLAYLVIQSHMLMFDKNLQKQMFLWIAEKILTHFPEYDIPMLPVAFTFRIEDETF